MVGKGGSQVGPVLLPEVPVGLQTGTQPGWKRGSEAPRQHAIWTLVTQSSQTQWSEPDTGGGLNLSNRVPSSRNNYK